ncbi:Hypothetical protein GLP15_1388 [Giardia lamblia P15]|uniref:Uncharacterized protein n=1 Tax=Giardia intestinalis (strain P15) TaxID=658858 RepID=E1EZ99_GIAIA|nr:Hypothetical protein GLP15_1388 [Giardia lamblia P15]
MANSGLSDSCSINQVSDSFTDAHNHEYCSKEQSAISCLSPLSSNHVKDESSKQTPLFDVFGEESPNEGQEPVSQPLEVDLNRTTDRNMAVSEMYKQTKTTISPEKRAALQVLYQKHGSRQSVIWYSAQSEIPRSIVSKFITFMEHGLDVRNLSYRAPCKTRMAKTTRFSPVMSMKGSRAEVFSVASPIQLNTVQTNLGSSILHNDLNNLVLQKRDEIVKKNVADTEKMPENKRKRRGNDITKDTVESTERPHKQRPQKQQQYSNKTPEGSASEIPSYIPIRCKVETEQLRKNRDNNRETLSARVRFLRIDFSSPLTPRIINQLSSQDARRAQLDFIERYRAALAEGRTAMFISADRYDLYVSGSKNSISLSLLSLFSSDGEMFCEIFLGLVGNEVISEWIMHVLQAQFGNKVPLIVTTHEILSALPNHFLSLAYSSILEVLSPAKHMMEIWEHRVKFYSLLNTNQTVEELLEQFSTEFLTLPKTSLLGKLAEIREYVWWEVYSSTWTETAKPKTESSASEVLAQ